MDLQKNMAEINLKGISMHVDKQWLDMIKWFLILSMLTEKYEVLCKANKKNILIVSLLMIGLNREAKTWNALVEDGCTNNNNSFD